MKSRAEYAEQKKRNIAWAWDYCVNYLKRTDLTEEIILEYAKERRKFLKWYHKNKTSCAK